MGSQCLQQLLAAIDRLNTEDPNQSILQGAAQPREVLYANQVSAWVLRLKPDASVWLRIAAHGQHVQRWKISRDRYPRTTAGYLRWRETLKTFHAETVAGLMKQENCSTGDIEHVTALILKRSTADAAELQALEDALCLVFLETQFEELKAKIPDQRMREVVRKTWVKMSEQAHQEALKLPMDNTQRAWLINAVSP